MQTTQTAAPQKLWFRGKVHAAGKRTVRGWSGDLHHLPICGSWTNRAAMYPTPFDHTSKPVDCQRCLAKLA